MAERITRRYIDKATGGPVTGALIRLVSVTTPGNDPYYMEEIVSTDPNKQGYYYATLLVGSGSPAVVPRGVYRVERDFQDGNGYVPWEGEESVSPGRVTSADPAIEPLADRLATTQVRAISFMTDSESTSPGFLPVIQDAIDAAATLVQSKRVVVGASGAIGQFSTWLGDYVTTPDGTDIDLAGARLQAWTNPDVSVVNCTGDVTIRNGFLKILSTGGLGRVVTMQDPAKRAVFIGVTFERPGTVAPTVAGPAGQECPAIFIGCKNVVLAPATPGSSTRLQCAIGCTGVYEVGGAAAVQLDQANVSGAELGDLIRTALKEAVVPPDAGLPFTDMKEFAEAVKQMWATEIPALKAKDEDLQEQIGAATSSSGISWEWERINTADAVFDVIVEPGAPGTITGVTPLHSYQKAYVRGAGKNAVLTLQCAIVFKFTASATTSLPYFGGVVAFDLTAFEAALATKYPAWGAAGGVSLRYNQNGLPHGFYFKRAFRAYDLDSSPNRLPWQSLDCVNGATGDGPQEITFCSVVPTPPRPTKGVQVHIPTAQRAAGAWTVAAAFELEIPASQSFSYANDGALGTIINFPYAL